MGERASELREFADALDKDRGHSKSYVTSLMRQAADDLDRLAAVETERDDERTAHEATGERLAETLAERDEARQALREALSKIQTAHDTEELVADVDEILRNAVARAVLPVAARPDEARDGG